MAIYNRFLQLMACFSKKAIVQNKTFSLAEVSMTAKIDCTSENGHTVRVFSFTAIFISQK
jgi:hypothetical protein